MQAGSGERGHSRSQAAEPWKAAVRPSNESASTALHEPTGNQDKEDGSTHGRESIFSRSTQKTRAADKKAVQETHWQTVFIRRSEQARAGSYFPVLDELLIGMPPLCDKLDFEIQHYISRLIDSMNENSIISESLLTVLHKLLTEPRRETCRQAALALDAACQEQMPTSASILATAAARCTTYAALKNCRLSALQTAGRALAYACDDDLPDLAKQALIKSAFEWMLSVSWEFPDVINHFGHRARRSACSGSDLLKRFRVVMQNSADVSQG